jgi:hypothetical protein
LEEEPDTAIGCQKHDLVIGMGRLGCRVVTHSAV